MDTGELPMALRAAYLALHRCSDARFAEFGVTADQFVLLTTLARGDALTQRELARRMPSDPSTVRAMLVLLEKQGLVRRDASTLDSRARTATLTAAGRRKMKQLWQAGEPLRQQMLFPLQTGDGEILVRLLRQIADALSVDALSMDASSFSEVHRDAS